MQIVADYYVTLDGVRTKVNISAMLGLTSFHLYVGGYYWGAFNKMLQGWHFYGNDYGEANLTTADREILLEMVLEYLAKLEA